MWISEQIMPPTKFEFTFHILMIIHREFVLDISWESLGLVRFMIRSFPIKYMDVTRNISTVHSLPISLTLSINLEYATQLNMWRFVIHGKMNDREFGDIVSAAIPEDKLFYD